MGTALTLAQCLVLAPLEIAALLWDCGKTSRCPSDWGIKNRMLG